MLQGTGTELDPFLITNLAELRTGITDADAYYKVTQHLEKAIIHLFLSTNLYYHHNYTLSSTLCLS